VLGLSGAGKSCFAEYLNVELHWLRIEADPPNGADAMTAENLRAPWDSFYHCNKATDLATELSARAKKAGSDGFVLSFSSLVVLSPEHISDAQKAGMTVVYLYGSAAHCIDAFLKRERASGRNLGLDHWLDNNKTYMAMSEPYFKPYRIHVFDIYGERRTHADVLAAIEKHIGR
jgi:gluconate kinase